MPTKVINRTLPATAVRPSLRRGNPAALVAVHTGQTVLDLGSRAGIAVLMYARRVGPTGKAYGLDMSYEMLALARQNQWLAGVENAAFLQGRIEAIPLRDNSVDVIVSNGVIKLSATQNRVLAEVFRVLKPGGRFAVSGVAEAMREPGCRGQLAAAGFEQIAIEPESPYRVGIRAVKPVGRAIGAAS